MQLILTSQYTFWLTHSDKLTHAINYNIEINFDQTFIAQNLVEILFRIGLEVHEDKYGQDPTYSIFPARQSSQFQCNFWK